MAAPLSSLSSEAQAALRKLGNAQNALGTLYMARTAAVDLAKGEAAVVEERDTWQKSCARFTQSAQTFGRVADAVNLALVNCNLGKLMRLRCASAVLRGQMAGGPTRQERMLHDKAIEYYQAALDSLHKRGTHPAVWDIVSVELAGAYLAFASLLQDNLGGVDPLVPELLSKALRLFNEEQRLATRQDTRKDPGGQRVASNRCSAAANKIVESHHRLAKYHADIFSQAATDTGIMLEQESKLGDLHYQRAMKMYADMGGPTASKNLLQVHLEAASMNLAAISSHKHLAAAYEHLTASVGALTALQEEARLARADGGSSDGNASGSLLREMDALKADVAMLLQELHRLFGTCLRTLLKEGQRRTGSAPGRKRASKTKRLFETYLRQMPPAGTVTADTALASVPAFVSAIHALAGGP